MIVKILWKGSRECGPAAEWEWGHSHKHQGEG